MSAPINMAAIRPEQGPPLSIPMSFFLTGPLALTAAGAVVFSTSSEATSSLWTGTTIAAVHLGTVGLLLTVMLGALYQMLPVIAGAAVPAIRLGHVVHALVACGAATLSFAQATSSPLGFAAAFVMILSGLLLFWLPVAFQLARTKAGGPSIAGMRMALVGLALVAALGLRLAYGRAGPGYTEEWVVWRLVHAHAGFLGWVGCLIAAISWQVVPMFYLTEPAPRWVSTTTLALLALSFVALGVVFFAARPVEEVAFAVLPGALGVWLLQPGWTTWAIHGRRRKRVDPGLRFWWLASACALGALVAGAGTAWLDDYRWPLVYGFLLLWGWAAAIVHGMLTRIVPFLVWLHRCSALVGIRVVPSARELYPDRWVATGWWLHLAALAAGLSAIGIDRPWAWRALGVSISATGAHLFVRLVGALVRAPARGRSAGPETTQTN